LLNSLSYIYTSSKFRINFDSCNTFFATKTKNKAIQAKFLPFSVPKSTFINRNIGKISFPAVNPQQQILQPDPPGLHIVTLLS